MNLGPHETDYERGLRDGYNHKREGQAFIRGSSEYERGYSEGKNSRDENAIDRYRRNRRPQ